MKSIRLSKCSIGEEEKAAVLRVLDNEYLGMGKEVQLFEQEIKEYLKTDLEVICVNTGTAALHLAVLCLDLKEGDEVLVPSITYVASFQAISATGAKPVACDVLEDTVFIDIQDAEKRITKKTKAIMPVHYASNSSEIDRVYELAQKYGLRVIEDAAQAMGCIRSGVPVGQKGDIICISFDGIKNITSGEGGVVITGDKKLAQRIKDARLLGVERDTEMRFSGDRSWQFDVHYQGFRYHMSDIMAAIGRVQLRKLTSFAEKRKKIARYYQSSFLGNTSIIPLNINYDEVVPHIFVVKTINKNRDRLLADLKSRGIATGFHYFPNHLLSLYKTPYVLPVSERLKEQLLTLPIHPDLSMVDADFVVGEIKKMISLF